MRANAIHRCFISRVISLLVRAHTLVVCAPYSGIEFDCLIFPFQTR